MPPAGAAPTQYDHDKKTKVCYRHADRKTGGVKLLRLLE
jgi:hypothetical protein